MIPGFMVAAILVLGVYRIVRLIGWDDLPPIIRARDWVVGMKVVRSGSLNAVGGLTNEEPELLLVPDRPTLDHFLHCAFCQGFWVSCAAYVAWIEEPRWTLYVLAPFAISGAVGLLAKNLDA